MVLALGAAASVGLAAPGPLCLVRDGKPVSTIVYPDDADRWSFDAAKWVCAYVRKSTGAYLRFVPESRAPDGTLISVGHTRVARKAGMHVADLKWDGHKMAVKGDVLFLVGRHEKLRASEVVEVNGPSALHRARLGGSSDYALMQPANGQRLH